MVSRVLPSLRTVIVPVRRFAVAASMPRPPTSVSFRVICGQRGVVGSDRGQLPEGGVAATDSVHPVVAGRADPEPGAVEARIPVVGEGAGIGPPDRIAERRDDVAEAILGGKREMVASGVDEQVIALAEAVKRLRLGDHPVVGTSSSA